MKGNISIDRANKQEEEVLDFVNHDLTNIVTPVNAQIFAKMLRKAGYPRRKINFIEKGFSMGFSLQYKGSRQVQRRAPNLEIRVGSKVELWNKVMTEVKDGRFVGPFQEVPYKHFIQSPIGLVPKDKGTKTRLIFHLSYPKNGESVNSGIPEKYCTVRYPDFEQAVKLCLAAGNSCKISRSDISRAFCNVPLSPKQWPLLIMKAANPKNGKVYYFVDKCLPFGSSISCRIFQEISSAIAYLVKEKSHGCPNLSYLDDFFFCALMKCFCDQQVQTFLDLCKDIGFPVTMEKTEWGSTFMTFLGLLLDTERGLVCIPLEKIKKALDMIEYFLNKKNKKCTVLELQRLCGFLNFLCKCIVPGRAFLRRMYANIPAKLAAHHHLVITAENRMDLQIWKTFLLQPDVFYRPFADFKQLTALEIDMYSDASRNF